MLGDRHRIDITDDRHRDVALGAKFERQVVVPHAMSRYDLQRSRILQCGGRQWRVPDRDCIGVSNMRSDVRGARVSQYFIIYIASFIEQPKCVLADGLNHEDLSAIVHWELTGFGS